MAPGAGPITVGIDIGTTSTKAVSVDGSGTVLSRARIAHRLFHPAPELMEHDARAAWRIGSRRALGQVAPAGTEVAGVCVSAMVPSLAPVNRRGVPVGPGVLYDDARSLPLQREHDADRSALPGGGSVEQLLRWAVAEWPSAAAYWLAQAVATRAIGGPPAIDSAVAVSLGKLLTGGRWNGDLLSDIGVGEAQLPILGQMGQEVGVLPPSGCAGGAVVAPGTVDALCEQIVSGAVATGDVLVICGATLVVWAVVDEWIEAPGLWTVPHTVAGKVLVGGASNAGGLFVDWARSLLGRMPAGGPTSSESVSPRRSSPSSAESLADPGRVPVWIPYARGERVPYHDPRRRSSLYQLDISMDPAALERAVYESTGFVVRHLLDRAKIDARRVVASGGGVRSAKWMQAMADTTGLAVETVAVPEGAALGAAFLARMASGLETVLDGAQAWAATGGRFEPDPAWQRAAGDRYRAFVEISERGDG